MGAGALAAPGLVSPSAAANVPRIGAIYTVPVQQQWIRHVHAAASNLALRGDIQYAYIDRVSIEDYPRRLRQLSVANHDLVIGDAFPVETEARLIAEEFPDQPFLMGSNYLHDENVSNFSVFDNYIQDATYLAGMLAGSLSTTGLLGLVGGYPIPETNRLMNAYIAGALDARPGIRIVTSFIESWYHPEKARTAAVKQIEAGADILLAERFGTSEAARERGALAIGVLSDAQNDFPNTVLTSALWHFAPTLVVALRNVKSGTFWAENYGIYSGMKHGGCSIAPLGTFEGRIPDQILELVAKREMRIRTGSFTVGIDDSRPRSG